MKISLPRLTAHHFEVKGLLRFAIIILGCAYPLIASQRNSLALICSGSIVAIGTYFFINQKFGADTARVQRPDGRRIFLAQAAFLLTLLTWLTFYEPMLKHFWVAYDEPVLLSINAAWFTTYDKCCARPLAGLGAYFGNLLLPGSANSLPIVSAIVRWGLALTLCALLIVLVPEGKALAIAAGTLMVVNPTEVLRFTPGLSLPYGGALLFLALASFAFALSYVRASRLMLLLSCVLLGVAFLHYETIFPVSVILPGLLFLLPTAPHRRLWIFAWYATTALLAIRLLLFLSGASYAASYQWVYAQHLTVNAFLEYFPILFAPIFNFVRPVADYSRGPLDPVALTIGLGTFIYFATYHEMPPKKLARIAIFAIVGVLLTLLPEVSVPVLLKASPGFNGDLTARLEFTPGPFQAVFWAALAGLAASFLPGSRYWFAAGIAAIVAISVGNSIDLQARRGVINPTADFRRESIIITSAAPIIDKLANDAVIFFVIPDDRPSPFGWGYHPFHMACLLFGRPAYAGHYSPEFGAMYRVGHAPTALNQENNYTPVVTPNLVFLRIDENDAVHRWSPDPDLDKRLVPPRNSAVTGLMGPCQIPKAERLKDGRLPFLSSR